MGPSTQADVSSLAATGTSQLPPLDAARILQQVNDTWQENRLGISLYCFPVAQALADLDLVKRQIKQPFMAKASVEATLSRLEGGLRAKTQARKG